MSEPFFAPEVVETCLWHLRDYDPVDHAQAVAAAQEIIDALHRAGFRLVRDPADKGSSQVSAPARTSSPN